MILLNKHGTKQNPRNTKVVAMFYVTLILANYRRSGLHFYLFFDGKILLFTLSFQVALIFN